MKPALRISSAKAGELVDLGEHQVDDVEPTHADLDLRLVRGVVGLPERRVLLPEALGELRLVHLGERRLDGALRRSELRHREIGEQQRLARGRHDRDQRLEGLGERRDAVVLELLRDRVHADPGVLDPLQHGGGLVDALLEAERRLPVVLVGDDGRGRHRVDGIRTDERLDVVGVGVGGVLGGGARPERALEACALLLQGREALGAELLPEGGVRELGVGDGRLPEQLLQLRLLIRPGLLDLGLELLVDGAVDAAHEEARDRRDAIDRLLGGGALFEAADVGFHHLVVTLEREDQGHVDVETVGDAALDRRHALGGRGDLHHQVRARDRLPEAVRLLDGGFGVGRELGRDLDADVAVGAARPLVDRREDVGGGANVLDGERVEDGVGVLAFAGEGEHAGVVVVALRDRLLEDRGVRGQPRDVAGGDHLLQLARGQQAATDVVVPGGLSETL